MAKGYPDYRYFLSPLSVADGGTGLITLTQNGVLLGNGGSPVNFAVGTANQVLRIPDAGGAPAFGAINLSKDAAVSGLLPVAKLSGVLPEGNGGTGKASWTAGSVVFAGAGALAEDNANLFWGNTNKRFGVGTTTPASPLHVLAPSGANLVALFESPDAANRYLAFKRGTNTLNLGFGLTTAHGYLYSSTGVVFIGADGNPTLYVDHSAGKVGIGITDPAATLDVAGSLAFSTPWDGARVYNNAAESISSGVLTALTFNQERYDNGGLHSTTSNTSRLTAQKAGKYTITAHIVFAADSAGFRDIYLRVNGATGDLIADHRVPAQASVTTALSVTTLYHLAAGDFVEVCVYQNSGAALNVLANSNYSPEFAMQWISP